MKRIYLFTTITALSVMGLNLKSQAQTKTLKHTTHKTAKTTPATIIAGKTEFVDFNSKTGNTSSALNARPMFASLLNEVYHKKLVAYDTWINYDPSGKNIFSKPIAYKTLMKRLIDTVVIAVVDKNTGDIIGRRKLTNDFTPDKLTGYRVMRQIITDKQTGNTNTVITGIAPTIALTLSNGDTVTASHAVCWFKYNQCRKALANKPIAGKQWDDAMWEAFFTGGKVRED